MSKVKIQGNASGTGVLTIEAPNTNTDRTITLPDTTGTLVDTTGATFTGGVTGTDVTLSGGVYVGGTGSANYLEDYEEGTWTATITTDGTDFSTSGRGTEAWYTKIGNKVTVFFAPSINSPTSGTGSLLLSGLPFTPSNTYSHTQTSGDIHFGRCDLIGSDGYFMQAAQGSTSIKFYYRINNSNPGTMSAAELNGNITPYLSGTLTYTTA